LTPPGGTSGIGVATSSSNGGTAQNKIKVKRLANKTTHFRGSSGMGKKIK